MKEIGKSPVILLLLLALSLTLTACAAGGQSQAPLENTLIYANLRESGPDREAIDEFNYTHEDVQIEVRDYLDAEGNGDKTRLLAEIIAGKGPDIIDMGYTADASTTLLPYQRMAQAGYLEDLWPYIENDTELGRGAVLEPPLKAAEVNFISPSLLYGSIHLWARRALWETEPAGPWRSCGRHLPPCPRIPPF